MAISIQFGKTNKARNSTLVPSLTTTVPALLKDGTSVVRPTFKIHLGYNGEPNFKTIVEYNYCYVAEFKRYYYITDITSETAAIILVSCEVDVLATFKEDILNTPAFVLYAESRYNAQVPDNRLPQLGPSVQNCNIVDLSMLYSLDGVFALTAVSPDASGETGAAATVLMGASNLAQLAEKLYAPDFWDSIKTNFYHPEEALIACMWTPIKEEQALGSGATTIKIGEFDLYTALNIKKTVTATFMVPFMIPYGDYRSFEPYTKYTLTLPGVGTVDFPMKYIYGHAAMEEGQLSFRVNMSASPVTGDVIYNIELQDASGGISGNGVAYTVKGNFGVEVPISRTVGRFGSLLQTLAGSTGSIAAGAIMGGEVGAAVGTLHVLGSIASSAVAASNINTNIVGSLGGWSVGSQYNIKAEAKTVTWDISDSPSRINKTIGRPLFANVSRLGSLSGLVKCTGAYVKTWGTNEEHALISQYVNSSINYLYGGLIIE